ncbi:hypothetical protein MTR67_038232, partial [Solanum verrucosum]
FKILKNDLPGHHNSGVGENLAKGGGDYTRRRAMQLRVSEKPNYNYATNQCASGKVCGHYTQVVWRNSVRLCCGRAHCNNGWWFISCNYDHVGNWVRQPEAYLMGGAGENLAKGSGDFMGRAAAQLWVAEKPNYNYGTNQCASGQVCGHYIQVVWRNSVRLGCGRARCNNGWWFISCDYDPVGNLVGQRPY